MRLPSIHGLIRRRLLVNYRCDPEVIQRQLPPRFRPKLQGDRAIAGICLIRLEEIRPKFVPAALGFESENAAHRIAVRWTDDEGKEREGVYIPRRDTGSFVNSLAGGRLFPGEHHRARFEVASTDSRIALEMRSDDGDVRVQVRGEIADALPSGSCFADVSEASRFFEGGSLGYSATSEPGRLDGITLKTEDWRVEPLRVEEVYSSWFADESKFPKGSAEFDCALIMRNVRHEWIGADDLYAPVAAAT